MAVFDHLIQANVNYRTGFPGPRPLQPKLRLAIVTCMDSRLDIFGALGLDIGDAHILRNAGGQVTDDVLRSLAISQRKIGTDTVMVIAHTNCGMYNFDDEQFRAELTEASGQAPNWKVPGFTDIEADVRERVGLVRECAWLPHRANVRGYVFDVATGAVTDVG